jgi:hypothetical protein
MNDVPKNELTIDHDKIACCDWGSCQYRTASETCYQIVSKWDNVMDPIEHLKTFGITFTPVGDRVNNETAAIAFRDGELEDMIGPEKSNALPEGHPDKLKYCWDADEIAEYRKRLATVKTIRDCFTYTRESSWDLWSAVPVIAGFVFGDYQMTGHDESPGIGPVFNMIAQSDNGAIGVVCALLTMYDLADDESFDGFDT